MTAPKRPKLEKIVWSDHCSFTSGGWRRGDLVKEVLTPCTVETVGWVVKETDQYVAVSSSIDFTEDNHQGSMCILKPVIIKRTRIKE